MTHNLFMWSCGDMMMYGIKPMASWNSVNINWNIGINRRYGDDVQEF